MTNRLGSPTFFLASSFDITPNERTRDTLQGHTVKIVAIDLAHDFGFAFYDLRQTVSAFGKTQKTFPGQRNFAGLHTAK